MSVTVIYSGKKHRQSLVIKVRWLMMATVCLVGALSAAAWQGYKHYSNRLMALTVSGAQQAHRAESKELARLKVQTDETLALLAGRVGLMNAQLGRLNALGERLAEKANLAEGEFDFSRMPAMGGEAYPEEVRSVDLSQLLGDLQQLSLELNDREQQLSLLESLWLNHNITEESILSGRPVVMKGSWLSSPYGIREDPFTKKATMHKGVDFAGREGMEVISTGAGVVTWSGKRFGYGLMVEVDHGNGYVTRYAHAKSLMVEKGDIVNKGEVVALMGSTGRSTGPHVHYEVLKQGVPVNPRKYIYR